MEFKASLVLTAACWVCYYGLDMSSAIAKGIMIFFSCAGGFRNRGSLESNQPCQLWNLNARFMTT